MPIGLLQKLSQNAANLPNNPLAMGLLAFGATGQGNDPTGAGIQAMLSTAQNKAKADEQAKLKAEQAALQSRVMNGFANGTVSPALLSQYAMLGGEGAGNLVDMFKFGRTPQTFTPGNMVFDPNTGKMSMPAPKMGEGMIWTGSGVQNAPGYTDALGATEAAKAWAGVDPAIAQYGAQQKIGYGYDLGRMGAQNQYDLGKMQYGSELGRGDFAYQQGVKDSSDFMQVYNPQTGNTDYMSKSDMRGMNAGGYGNPIASRSDTDKAMSLEQAKFNEAKRQEIVTGGATAAKQMARLNQLEGLANEGLNVGGLTPVYQQVGSIAADLGIKVDGLSDLQQAEKVILQLAQDIPLPPGAASNIDVQQRLQQLPNLTDTPEAFANSVKAMKELADLNLTVGDYVQQYGYTPEIQQQINDLYSQWGKGR